MNSNIARAAWEIWFTRRRKDAKRIAFGAKRTANRPFSARHAREQ